MSVRSEGLTVNSAMNDSHLPMFEPDAMASVQVVVRLRPMNDNEKKHGTLPVVTGSTRDKSVTVIRGQGARQARSMFHFDHVFSDFSSQEEVFDETLKPVIG
jgi:kinesin family protein 11